MTLSDATPPTNPVRTNNIVAGERDIAFSLSNPNAEGVQVELSLSPRTLTASYRADGTSFNPRREDLELVPMGETNIRIEGLAYSTSYTITMTTKDSNGNPHAANTVVTASTLADMTPPAAKVTTDDIVAGEQDIAFSLRNPNAEGVQVVFSISPAASAASYSAERTSFDPTNLMLDAMGEADIRITGLASSTSYTITMTTKDTNDNAHADEYSGNSDDDC